MIIDKLAYNSKLRNIAPISKLLFSMSVLVICIWANSFLVSVFTALTMLFLIIFIGKTSYKNVFHLMTVPIVFIIMGAAAIAISIGQNSSDMLFSLHFGNTYFGVSHTSLLSAVRVMIKCFGAVSCMYFLSLTTPMVDLFTLLRKSIIPNFIIEIAELIYRYIFVLFDVSHRIHTAQDARLGYCNLRVSYHSTAQLASNLFIRSFNQAEKRIPLWSHAVMTAKSTLLCRRLIIRSNLTYLRSYSSQLQQRLRYFQERRGFDEYYRNRKPFI